MLPDFPLKFSCGGDFCKLSVTKSQCTLLCSGEEMVVKWLLNLFFCVGLGKHFETLFVQLMLVICSESNEGFLLVPAVPCPSGQAGYLALQPADADFCQQKIGL